ncbi:PREDICTED: uncharacterized protein LOC108359419 [Rhagoletis zephyria]|uniref:uncharacterized protein LOC108359419 n=1 Tax=Rhagoletis zephyria TaxID=28612 RepID=UPI0008113EB1|nr:PREDICTED: uncharacterized protein LOC108359419 [Rhagoletis zephyria]
MNAVGRSKHLDHDIFFDTCIETATHSFRVFSSKYSVSLIKSHIEPNRKHDMVNATFKVVPVDPFNQLLIIYVCYIKSVFPFVFILMSRKTEEAYIDVFRYINDNVIDLECAKFLTDYEMPLQNCVPKPLKSVAGFISVRQSDDMPQKFQAS